jgi:hypothetical protein
MLGQGVPLPASFVTAMFGFDKPDELKFTEQVLKALERISPALLPSLIRHPFADQILAGREGVAPLAAALDAATDEDTQAALLDALAEIAARDYATLELVRAVSRALERTKSAKVTSVACRALATARDPGFVKLQRGLLLSQSPSEQRVAARLVGYARDVESVPILLDLIHGDRLAVMDAAIWALGEIRSADALPKLHRLLHAEIRVADCLEAIGKIADESSLVRLLPILVEGADEHREKATWATARILRANDGRAFADDVASSLAVALERAADRDASRLVRFHAIVGLSLLGRALEPTRILAALGGQLGAEDLDAMGGFFAARNKPTPGAPRAPAAPKPPPARGAPPPTAAKPKGKGPGKT